MGAAEEVDEEVAGDSAAVGLPFAPLEEVLGVPGNFGGGAEEAWPVAGLGAGVERDGVVPGADGGVAVPAGGDHVEFADGSGGKQFLGLGVDDGADALAADLKDAVGGAGGGDDLGTVGVEVDHGLFEVDVFAGVHGVDGGLLVPVVGSGDEDGVDVLAGEDLAVVAGGEEVVAPELFGVGEAAVVAVGYGDEFDSGDLERGARCRPGPGRRRRSARTGCGRWPLSGRLRRVGSAWRQPRGRWSGETCGDSGARSRDLIRSPCTS